MSLDAVADGLAALAEIHGQDRDNPAMRGAAVLLESLRRELAEVANALWDIEGQGNAGEDRVETRRTVEL